MNRILEKTYNGQPIGRLISYRKTIIIVDLLNGLYVRTFTKIDIDKWSYTSIDQFGQCVDYLLLSSDVSAEIRRFKDK